MLLISNFKFLKEPKQGKEIDKNHENQLYSRFLKLLLKQTLKFN